MRTLASLAAAATIVAALPASAQGQQARPKLVVVSADAAFTHAGSGMILPATLIGLSRREVQETEAPQLDIAAAYPSDDAALTVYVYRTTSGSVPVWFDRARWAIETLPRWGKPTLAAEPAAVAPPGATAASGLLAGWTLANHAYTGTGVALLPVGEWLVKLRYSSKTLDGAGVAARLREAIAGLGWPAAMPPVAAAQLIQDCPSPMAFEGNAKTAPNDGTSAIMGALLAGVARNGSVASKPDATPVTWCRDVARLDMAGVYRPNADPRSYLLALSDAGRGVWVGPGAGGLLGDTAKPTWSVDLVLPGQTLSYPAQDRLPRPEQVMELLGGRPMSSISTLGKERKVTLSPSAFGTR